MRGLPNLLPPVDIQERTPEETHQEHPARGDGEAKARDRLPQTQERELHVQRTEPRASSAANSESSRRSVV